MNEIFQFLLVNYCIEALLTIFRYDEFSKIIFQMWGFLFHGFEPSPARIKGRSYYASHNGTEIVNLKALLFSAGLVLCNASLPHIFRGFTLRYFRVKEVMLNISLKLFGHLISCDCGDLYSCLVMIGSAIFIKWLKTGLNK